MDLFTHKGLPKAWKEALSTARAQQPDTCILLIHKATATIHDTDWLPEQATAAASIIDGLPRAKARTRRLRGLAKRLAAARRRKQLDAQKAASDAKRRAEREAEQAQFIPGLLS